MAAEYSANAVQEVAANASVIFTASPVPCNRGMICHRDESGLFRLASPALMGVSCRPCCRCVNDYPSAVYQVSFHGNIAVPTGGVVGPISLALAVDGEVDPSSIMTVTPTVAAAFTNVGAAILVEVPCICRCASVSVRNVSDQAVNVQNANILFDFAGIRR